MQVSVMGIIIAEGSEVECAIYTHALLESLRLKNEQDKEKEAQKEVELIKKFENMTLEDLIRMERDKEE